MPPLYIVDGIRMGTGYNFNIQDVASIEVLKDASAAAIYGAQAAGGVILVTTKRGGQNDKMSVSLNAYYGVRQPVNLYQLLGRDQYFRARQAFGTDVTAWGNPAGLPDTDWLDELYGNGQDQNYTLSLSGGTAKASYYVSGNYQREDGIRLDNSFKRYNLRINSDYQLGKRLKVGESLMAWKGVFNRNPDGTVNIPFRSVPTMPVRDAGNAVGGWGRQPVGGYFAGDNPVAGVLSHHRNDQSYAVEGNVYADLEILSGAQLPHHPGHFVPGQQQFILPRSLRLRLAGQPQRFAGQGVRQAGKLHGQLRAYLRQNPGSPRLPRDGRLRGVPRRQIHPQRRIVRVCRAAHHFL
jgi:TonB-dependent SusC/RagA subfamily outer membrane receptor